MNRNWSRVAAAMMLASWLAAAHAVPADLANMVRAEYDFSDTAKKEGYKASFLKYLTNDNIAFENTAFVNGHDRVQGRPDLPGLLQWYPEYAVVSNAGNLGFSTGPWVFSKEGKDLAFGHFFSIWRKQPDGSWLNALDVGVDHPEIKPAPTKLPAAGTNGHAESTAAKSKDHATDVRAAEAELAKLASASGYVAAVERMAHPDLRVYRNGHAPVVGAGPAIGFLKQQKAVGPTKLNSASASGDFGYAFGMVGKSSGDGSSHAFVHVWQQVDGVWRLLAELMSPVTENAK